MLIYVSKTKRKRKKAGSFCLQTGVDHMILAAFAAAVVLIDQSSKTLIKSYLQTGESFPLISGVLHLTHIKNTGAAFGLMQDRQILFLTTAVVLIAAILVFYRQIKEEGPWVKASLGLILGGAIGNFIDRTLNGEVTDFIDIRIWPVFNVADSAIVVGVILLVAILLLAPKRRKHCDIVQTTESDSNISNDEIRNSSKTGRVTDYSDKRIEIKCFRYCLSWVR